MKATNRAVSKMVLTTFDEAAVRAAAEQCQQRLGAAADIVFAFVTPDFRRSLEEFLELLQVYGHARRIVGCSGSGMIGTAEENEGVCGFSVIAMSLPNTQIEVRKVNDGMRGDDSAADDDATAAIALFDPLRGDPQEWLRQWNTLRPMTPVIGGLASGGRTRESMFLFDEGGVVDADGLVIRFRGGVAIEPLVSQGCLPIGSAALITEGSETSVARLGGRPAYKVLREAVEGLMNEGAEIAPGSIHAGLAVSEYIDEFRRGDFLVRNLLGADAASGRVDIGAAVEVGRTLQFQFRDRDAADQELRAQCQALQELNSRRPVAVLLFSCAGRGQQFFGVPNHDAGVIAEILGPQPLAGFFCNGEIGPVGVASYLHGYTASAAVFYDRSAESASMA
jgi:small ligand-binding sensory domain FIST